MQKSGKLELTWVGKYEKQEPLEPRILIEKPELSYGDTNSGNMLIHGDNLLALRALEQDFAGKVKCIYIDPPYNIDVANPHYEDGLEHSEWLNILKPRLEILRNLLSNNGSIYVQIDNTEQAYLKVLMDEVFLRKNFVQMISVKRASPAGFKVINPGPLTVTEYVLLYAKNKESMFYNPQRIPVGYDNNYNLVIKNPDDPPQKWLLVGLIDLLYEQWGVSSWREVKQRYGNSWKVVRDAALGDLALELKDSVVSVRDPHKPSDLIKRTMDESKRNKDKVLIIPRENYSPIYIYNGGSLSFYRDKLREIDGTLTPTELLTDFWTDINYAGIANEGNVQFKNSKKPEMLIKRIFDLATEPSDLVLDSFLGSGTTAAVAHKMGRRWIGIELGDHAYTHCKVRLDKVVDGEQGGISKSVGWQGGGGYKFYELAPSLLEKHPVLPVYQINKEYTFEMLCEAICKLEGFTYKPEGEMHGHSSENRFIHISREFVSGGYIMKLMKEVSDKRSVLIYGVKIQSGLRLPDNIEVKKIPKDLLKKCRFESEVR